VLGSAWQRQLDEAMDPNRTCSDVCSFEMAGVAALRVRLPGTRVFYDQTNAAIFVELTWCVLLGGARLR
jgi:hypothetical protein